MARGKSKVGPDEMARSIRDAQILNMRVNLRLSEEQIGKQVDLSQTQVSRILHRMLRERVAASQGTREELLQEAKIRFDYRYGKLLRIAEGQVKFKRVGKDGTVVEIFPGPEDCVSALRAMKSEEEAFSRLLGINAPVKVEHTFRQEPMSPEEIAKMREEATPEELQAIAAGNQEVMIAVLTRANVPLLSN